VSRQTVLVVDDEASIADGLRLTLESEGMNVRLAGSVRTALAAVAQTDVQAAIVDLMSPLRVADQPVTAARATIWVVTDTRASAMTPPETGLRAM